MSTNYYTIEGIGLVKLTRRKNSNRITLRVKANGEISVNYPWFTPKNDVAKFVLNNTDWIKKQLEKHKEKKTHYQPGDVIELFNATIKIEASTKSEMIAYRDDKSVFQVKIPQSLEADSERVQNFISKVIVEASRFEAKKYLPERVLELASIHKFKYKQVFVKNLKSRWGSCSSHGNINLNVHLMRLPPHLIDYIILHELVHTVEANHGPGFWKLLDKVSGGNARKYDNEVKKFKL
ncbi:MAG: SprT family zinc-dependent metalloprotease [Prolixibacteraceae bacterium]|jgi:predicted metal-dependent hydrolase|nr:SprT family zinc-dependent metalloprotease [Prolixibacteraceae bacterium]